MQKYPIILLRLYSFTGENRLDSFKNQRGGIEREKRFLWSPPLQGFPLALPAAQGHTPIPQACVDGICGQGNTKFHEKQFKTEH
jgi:hypothetical protein